MKSEQNIDSNYIGKRQREAREGREKNKEEGNEIYFRE